MDFRLSGDAAAWLVSAGLEPIAGRFIDLPLPERG